jgi:hypothetical protein
MRTHHACVTLSIIVSDDHFGDFSLSSFVLRVVVCGVGAKNCFALGRNSKVLWLALLFIKRVSKKLYR